MFQLLTKGLGNSIPTIGANNRQEPSVDGPILFQDQRRQSASAQSNLGFNTVSQNATNVPTSTQRAAPNNARNTTTSNVENTVKNIATDVQRLEGLEDVEETLERMDEKLGKLVKAEESEEKARKSKKRQDELPQNVSGDTLKDRFKDSGMGDRAGQLAGAAGGAVAGAGLLAMLFGPQLMKDMKEKSEEGLKRWDETINNFKSKMDEVLGTGNMIQEATDEEQIATKLALQSGAAGKVLTTGVDAITSKPVANVAAKTAGLAAKGTVMAAEGLTKVTASTIDAATTAINQAGQTTTTDSRGRQLTRNTTTGRLEAKAEGTRLRQGIDDLAQKANAAKAATPELVKGAAKGAAKGAGSAAKISAMVAQMVARNGAQLVAKALPLAGAGIGGAMSINKMIEGDYYGAAAAGAGAVLSFVPGIGTAGAVGVGAYELAREIYNNLEGQYPENDPNAAEKWPEVLEQTKEAVVKYVADGVKQYKMDKANIKKSRDSGLFDKDLIGNSEIDLKMAETATTGELESILRDDDLSDDDTASVKAILAKRAEAIEQGTTLSVAPGEAASLEADQAAESVLASNVPAIDPAKMKSATDQVEELAMAEAGGNQPVVNVAPAQVSVPKSDAPNVSVSVNVGDPMLNKDRWAHIILPQLA
tara:strand:+ start:6937 stop:8880 length:1944 start_codon:yes stop_codon:yes gene_type:complete